MGAEQCFEHSVTTVAAPAEVHEPRMRRIPRMRNARESDSSSAAHTSARRRKSRLGYCDESTLPDFNILFDMVVSSTCQRCPQKCVKLG